MKWEQERWTSWNPRSPSYTKLRVRSVSHSTLAERVQRSASEYLSGDQLQREFRLTRAEANVALLLAQRRRNREIAQELGVSEHTARRHTEKVMGKLGVHRRTDVWQAILSVGQQSILPRRRS